MAKPYESDLTRFVRELIAQKPEIVEEQRKGRAMWWDKKLDPETQKRFQQSRINQKAYVYQPDT